MHRRSRRSLDPPPQKDARERGKRGTVREFSMKTGIVKFFNDAKGFGFIRDDADGNELFVHLTGLIDRVIQNDKVSFDVIEGRKGPNAINVKKI